MKDAFRTESDSMGSMQVPAEALYGAQTARAILNFPVSGLRLPRSFLQALGRIKFHAARVNAQLGLLKPELAAAIQQAAREVIDGRLDTHFVVDVFQTGSGTSTNMNANEVIAARATELLGGERGQRLVHPNDHVNLGQSSNDVFPSAIHLAALEGLIHGLVPALSGLEAGLRERAAEFHEVMKIGRTHLQDAAPVRLGSVFEGYASQVRHAIARVGSVCPRLGELALGGTAVGTGLNTHPEFARGVITGVADDTGLNLREAENHFEAQGARDACVEASGILRTVAISLGKVANDIRWLGSGPRGGLGELKLPALQPGSSIMPGKVNPVLCEMMLQVGAQVVGNDATIAWANGLGSTFELNVMMPVIAHNLLQSIALLTQASQVFAQGCVAGLKADVVRCESNVEQSLGMGAALVPAIGYDRTAELVKRAYETGRTVREVAREQSGLAETEIDRLLDPLRQARS